MPDPQATPDRAADLQQALDAFVAATEVRPGNTNIYAVPLRPYSDLVRAAVAAVKEMRGV